MSEKDKLSEKQRKLVEDLAPSMDSEAKPFIETAVLENPEATLLEIWSIAEKTYLEDRMGMTFEELGKQRVDCKGFELLE